MKSTSENHVIYTTYTTHAICVLGEDEVEDEGEEEGEGVKGEGDGEGEGEGEGVKVVIKQTQCFSSVSQPNIFYDAKNIRSFFMTKRRHLKNLRTFYHKKRTILL
jgi:hypothetical protein